MIPFLDLKATYTELKEEIDEAVSRVFESGWYVLGPEVKSFEAEFANFVGSNHCVGVGSGLDALILALRALNVGLGDEVIVPANTYIATWLAVSEVKATIIPVEPDPTTHCIDPALVEAAITKRTKVIIPVHLYGQPANMPALREISKKYNLRIVEDAAQAHGASINGTMIGKSTDIVAWSFYPGKNLGAFGDGGAITTDDACLAERISTLRNYGSSKKYINIEKGMNSRLDPVQAAILGVKLRYLMSWNKKRREIANKYKELLTGLPICLPNEVNGTVHAWHLFVIATPEREQLRSRLDEQNINTLIHYPVPPFRQKAYAEMNSSSGRWPIADRLSCELLSLPIGPHMSISSVEVISDSICTAFK